MDGTLIDSIAVVVDAYGQTVRGFGLPLPPAALIRDTLPAGPVMVILERLLGRRAGPEEADAYQRALADRAATVHVYPGIRPMLESISRRIPLAVFTGASTASCRTLLGATGLLDSFDVIVGGDEVDQPKPSPNGVLLACEQMGVPPERTAYVGDHPYDLESARRAGTLAVAASWGSMFDPDRSEHADVILAEPADLTALVRRE